MHPKQKWAALLTFYFDNVQERHAGRVHAGEGRAGRGVRLRRLLQRRGGGAVALAKGGLAGELLGFFLWPGFDALPTHVVGCCLHDCLFDCLIVCMLW